jgi:N utilization substance protein A
VGLFGSIPNIEGALVDRFVEQGFLSFDDLSIMDPEELAQLEGLDVVKATEVVQFAEVEAERMPKEPPRKSRSEAVAEKAAIEEPGPEPTTPTEVGETAPSSPTESDVAGSDAAAVSPEQPGVVVGDNGEPLATSEEKPTEEAGTSPPDESH